MKHNYSLGEKEMLANIWLLRSKGHLGIALVAAVLGGAAILWIIAAFGWLDLSNRSRMEQRTMQATGATSLPRDQIKILTQDSTCLHIDGGFANGETVHFYAKTSKGSGLRIVFIFETGFGV